MRLFRRARDTKTSVIRREAVSATAEALAMPPARPSSPIAPIADFVDSEPHIPAGAAGQAQSVAVARNDDSDVFVYRRAKRLGKRKVKHDLAEVTLFVHGWHNVEPGPLSWTFPSLRSALDAVKRMKNAIGWCVVSGTGWTDLAAARAGGAVLVEQLT